MLAQLGDGVLGRVLAEHQRDRVARQVVDGEHDHEHHAEQDGHGEQEAADDERQQLTNMGGPDMAPHTPRVSERPGKPVALLYFSSQVFESVRLYSTGWIWKPFTLARAAMISFVV